MWPFFQIEAMGQKIDTKNFFFRTKFSLLTHGLDLGLNLKKGQIFWNFLKVNFHFKNIIDFENRLTFFDPIFLEFLNFQLGVVRFNNRVAPLPIPILTRASYFYIEHAYLLQYLRFLCHPFFLLMEKEDVERS